MFLDELTFENNALESEANAVCNGDINCLFDAASTKDVSMGKSTVEVAIKFEEESKMTSKCFCWENGRGEEATSECACCILEMCYCRICHPLY